MVLWVIFCFDGDDCAVYDLGGPDFNYLNVLPFLNFDGCIKTDIRASVNILRLQKSGF